MKKSARVFIILLLPLSSLFSQAIDSFSDGNFTANPVWNGDITHWQIVQNSDVSTGAINSYTLRLDGAAVTETDFLVMQRTDDWGDEQSWGFWIGRRNRGIINDNYSTVWLWANKSSLKTSTENGTLNLVNGYRIKIGTDPVNEDKILLQKVVNGVESTILASSGTVSKYITDYGFLVRVTRTAGSEWSIYTSALPTSNGTGAVATEVPSQGNTTIFQGQTTDGEFTNFANGYMGVSAKHGYSDDSRTAAEFDQFYFAPNSDASLPVTISTFTAKFVNGQVRLFWKTESEIDNVGFVVCRSQFYSTEFVQTSSLIPSTGESSNGNEYNYVDQTVDRDNFYYYKLESIDQNGNKTTFGPISIATDEESGKFELQAPTTTTLVGNYPNPFNPETMILFNVKDDGTTVELEIYNSLGRVVRSLLNRPLSLGEHSIVWDGRDNYGNFTPAGIYFCQLIQNGSKTFHKMIKLD